MTTQEMLKYFYLIASILFLGIGVFNSIVLANAWGDMATPSRVSTLLSNIFNYMLCFVFGWMFKDQLPKKVKATEEDLEKIFNEVQGGKDGKGSNTFA